MEGPDTLTFEEHSPEEYKAQTRSNWTKAPCGSDTSAAPFGSAEFFTEVERFRYATHPWILEEIDKLDVRGKSVLEVGFGMGTDHVALHRRGARAFGIDLTPRCARTTRARLEQERLEPRLVNGDAERLPFRDGSFDVVYSLGVIHHSPDTARIVDEIHRVLKPGGRCWLAVYHKHSLFFWWSVFLVDWVYGGGYQREGLQQRLSRIEHPNDNPDMVIRLFKRSEFADLFARFSQVDSRIEHLRREDVTYLGRYLPRFSLRPLARRLGWYVIVEARK